MDLIERLALAAKQNAGRINSPKRSSSVNAVVTGYDKTTGQFVVNRDGVSEMADSATTGGLKMGVEAPTIQGKAFATPHTPPPAIPLSAPHTSKREEKTEHEVYIAFLPIAVSRLVTGLNTLGVLHISSITGVGSPQNLDTTITFQPGKRSSVVSSNQGYAGTSYYSSALDFVKEGYTTNSMGGFVELNTLQLPGYLMLREAIDFVFPQKAPLPTVSSIVLQQVAIPEASGAQFGTVVLPSSQINLIDLAAPEGYYSDYIVPLLTQSIAIIGINPGGNGDGNTSPFLLKQLLKSAFARAKLTKSKVLIVFSTRVLSQFDQMPFYVSSPTINRSPRDYPDDGGVNPSWDNSQRIANANLLGVVCHGEGSAILNRATLDPNPVQVFPPEGGAYYKEVLAYSANVKADSALAGNSEKSTYKELITIGSNFQNAYKGANGDHGHYWKPHLITPLKARNKQKEFLPLINRLKTVLGEKLYVDTSLYFSGIYKDDPLQTLYGDSHTPHFWIKGLTEANIDKVDLVAFAQSRGISTFYQYFYGFRLQDAAGNWRNSPQ